MLRVLEEEGIRVGAIAGTSIGAMAALCFAGGRLDVFEEIARGATHRTVLAYLDPQLGRGGWLGGRRIARELNQHFAGLHLEDLPIPAALIAADLDTAEEVRLSAGPAISAVQASIGLPGVFYPITRDGRTLIDGGMVANLPIAAARELAPHLPVVAVDLMGDYEGYASASNAKGQRSALSTVRAAFLMMITQQTRLVTTLDPPDVMVTVPAGHIGTGAFTRAAELIALGRDAAQAQLPAIRAAMAAQKTGS